MAGVLSQNRAVFVDDVAGVPRDRAVALEEPRPRRAGEEAEILGVGL
jgi:hypothetical protein